MSDSFQMLVDTDATAKNAKALCKVVIDRLRELELIAGRLSPECVLGEGGYKPGPGLPAAYTLKAREGKFWELVTCGVEPCAEWGFNEMALGEACEGIACPSCAARADVPEGESTGEFMEAIEQVMTESGKGAVKCPKCRKSRPVTEWTCKPPLGFGHLSFRFWNWPPFDSKSWKIDIPKIVREATGHTIIETYGRI